MADTPPKTRVVIDTETIGLKNTAPIIQIGAALFEYERDTPLDTLLINISPESALENRPAEGDTLRWWLTEPTRREALTEWTRLPPEQTVTIGTAVNALYEWVGKHNPTTITMNGPQFDGTLLATVAPRPWKYWNERDYRTDRDRLIDTIRLFGLKPPTNPENTNPHRALDDAIFQGAHIGLLERFLADHIAAQNAMAQETQNGN